MLERIGFFWRLNYFVYHPSYFVSRLNYLFLLPDFCCFSPELVVARNIMSIARIMFQILYFRHPFIQRLFRFFFSEAELFRFSPKSWRFSPKLCFCCQNCVVSRPNYLWWLPPSIINQVWGSPSKPIFLIIYFKVKWGLFQFLWKVDDGFVFW